MREVQQKDVAVCKIIPKICYTNLGVFTYQKHFSESLGSTLLQTFLSEKKTDNLSNGQHKLTSKYSPVLGH